MSVGDFIQPRYGDYIQSLYEDFIQSRYKITLELNLCGK